MKIVKGIVIEGSVAVPLGRVVLETGADAKQADISSVTVKVFDADTGALIGTTLTPAVAAVVYDTLQLDARWTQDTTGYNFAIPVSGSYFPEGDRNYRVEVKVTPVGADPFLMLFDLEAVPTYSD